MERLHNETAVLLFHLIGGILMQYKFPLSLANKQMEKGLFAFVSYYIIKG